MYWPNGIPRVYAVNGPGINPQPVGDDVRGKDEEESSEENALLAHQQQDSTAESSTDRTPISWAEEAIHDLCVFRGGYLLATMTQSSIVIWQTKVCYPFKPVRGIKKVPLIIYIYIYL